MIKKGKQINGNYENLKHLKQFLQIKNFSKMKENNNTIYKDLF